MKKITQLTVLVAAMFCCNLLQAQTPFNHYWDANAQHLQAQRANLFSGLKQTRSTVSMFIDHSGANYDDQFFYTDFNSLYNAATDPNDSFGLKYLAVNINSIAGETDFADPAGTFMDWTQLGMPNAYPSTVAVTIDSIIFAMGYANFSGMVDTFKLQLVNTQANGTPGSTVLWEYQDTLATSFQTDNDWTAGYYFKFPCGYSLNAGQAASFLFNYYDPSKMDSLSVSGGSVKASHAAGYGDQSTYKTSWLEWSGIFNTPTKNSNLSVGGAGVDYYGIQNWQAAFLVHFDWNVGVNDVLNNLTVNSVYPNPSSTTSNVHFFLGNTSNLEVNIVDVTGKTVQSTFNGLMVEGAHDLKLNTSNLASGVYFVSIKAGNGNPVVSKLVVSH